MDYDLDMALGGNLYDDASPDILGIPNAQADFWDWQGLPDNCEPIAESFIIRQFGYDNISTNEFAYISQANGWYTPGEGTPMGHSGEMMDLFGIENHTVENATVEQLAAEIAAGHGVIVGVNSDELWNQGPLQEFENWLLEVSGLDNSNFVPANHAICVTGMDISDPDHPMVIVNDPGHPDGAGQPYPLDRFMDAWENSDFFMKATNDSLPAFAASNAHDGPSFWDGILQAAGDFAESLLPYAEPLLPYLDVIGEAVLEVAGATIADWLSPAGDDIHYIEVYAYLI